MKLMLQSFWLILFCCVPLIGNCQHYTTTLDADIDSYTDTQNPTSNYETSTSLEASTKYFTGRLGSEFQYHRRTYVRFDLSGIPSNAIVYSAKLKLTRATAIQGTFSWNTKLVTSSWTESGITANNQPSISTLSNDIVNTSSSTASVQEMDVTNMAYRMVYGAATNYGWCVQVSDESANSNTGCSFYSSEYGTSSDRPKLEVKYYLPVTLSSVSIVHESSTSASDGSITFTHTAIDGEGHTYSWMNSSGTQISTEQNPGDLGYGWYGVTITGEVNGQKEYFGFLVGTECEEVTIEYTTRPEFTHNAYIYDRVISGGIDYRDENYGNTNGFRTGNWNNSPWTDLKSYIDFNTYMDDAFAVNQADLLLQGWAHWNASTTNPAQFNKVTSYWNEDVITWNADPTDTGTSAASLPNTSSSTEDKTVDMIDLWDDWKQNNGTNYGVLFELEDFDDDYNTRQMYYSPNASTSTDRPSWTFKLALYYNDAPYYCDPVYAGLERRLTGTKYETQKNSLYFYYDEEYAQATSNLIYSIYQYDDMLNPVMTGTTNALSRGNGRNQYILDASSLTNDIYVIVVTNDKDEKRYLRFEKL